MISNLETRVFSRRNLIRALILPATLITIVACDQSQSVTAPELAAPSSEGSFARAAKVETFGVRAHGTVQANWGGDPTLGPTTKNVVSVTRGFFTTHHYCLTLSPAAFPDPKTAVGVATSLVPGVMMQWVGYKATAGDHGFGCPVGTVVIATEGTATKWRDDASFTFIVM